MRCTTPEISWHNRDPVLSIDIQNGTHKTPANELFWRLATGGADSHVVIWHLIAREESGTDVKCVSDLERHQRAVNVVRFSPSGAILASGDDESAIILWKQKEHCEYFTPSDNNENKEQWSVWKILKGHIEDVYDISWSPDSNALVSGSVDNTAIVWDVHKGRNISILSDYKGFVQGVTWDPCNQYICTISTDRQCRLIDITTLKTIHRVHKSKIPVGASHTLSGKMVRLFYDDTFKSFFRRLTFSLDGTLIIVPSGIIEPLEPTGRISNATMIFSRHNMKEPVMVLPSADECTIAIRCCPVIFELNAEGPTSMVPLPYRIVFAVATHRSVLLYDTQQTSPIAVISNLHYTRLTDVAWSDDGSILIVSSTDGYCSLISFQHGELGKKFKITDENTSLFTNSMVWKNQQSSLINNTSSSSSTKKECNVPSVITSDLPVTNEKVVLCTNKAEGLLEKSTASGNDKEAKDIKLTYSEENIGFTENKKTPQKVYVPTIVPTKAPRRVELITLSSPKRGKMT